jgi:hypothetical protein
MIDKMKLIDEMCRLDRNIRSVKSAKLKAIIAKEYQTRMAQFEELEKAEKDKSSRDKEWAEKWRNKNETAKV